MHKLVTSEIVTIHPGFSRTPLGEHVIVLEGDLRVNTTVENTRFKDSYDIHENDHIRIYGPLIYELYNASSSEAVIMETRRSSQRR